MLYFILMTKPLRAVIEIISECLHPNMVIEIGSRQAINQEEMADLRSLFPNSKYVGVDMIKGPGVDLIQIGESLPFGNNSQELVLCLETFEHCDTPWKVAEEIKRVVKKTGLVIVSSQQNFPIHLHPSDYFRFTPMGLKSFFSEFESQLVVAVSPPFDEEVKLNPQHVIFVGSKIKNSKLFNTIKRKLKENVGRISVHKPYRHRVQDALKFIKRGFVEIFFRQEIEFF